MRLRVAKWLLLLALGAGLYQGGTWAYQRLKAAEMTFVWLQVVPPGAKESRADYINRTYSAAQMAPQAPGGSH